MRSTGYYIPTIFVPPFTRIKNLGHPRYCEYFNRVEHNFFFLPYLIKRKIEGRISRQNFFPSFCLNSWIQNFEQIRESANRKPILTDSSITFTINPPLDRPHPRGSEFIFGELSCNINLPRFLFFSFFMIPLVSLDPYTSTRWTLIYERRHMENS